MSPLDHLELAPHEIELSVQVSRPALDPREVPEADHDLQVPPQSRWLARPELRHQQVLETPLLDPGLLSPVCQGTHYSVVHIGCLRCPSLTPRRTTFQKVASQNDDIHSER